MLTVMNLVGHCAASGLDRCALSEGPAVNNCCFSALRCCFGQGDLGSCGKLGPPGSPGERGLGGPKGLQGPAGPAGKEVGPLIVKQL